MARLGSVLYDSGLGRVNRDQSCRAAFRRIASAEECSFGATSDRRFETSSATSSSVACSCSSRGAPERTESDLAALSEAEEQAADAA
jgi:hypothetical protein